jgi:hypothetical protein
MMRARCADCALEAHLPLAAFLLAGARCPGCGATLVAPPPEPEERLRQLLGIEDRLLQELS